MEKPIVFPWFSPFSPRLPRVDPSRATRHAEVEFGGEGAATHGHLPAGDLLAEPLALLDQNVWFCWKKYGAVDIN